MAKRKEKKHPNLHIIVLAYFHRYGWIVLMLLLACFTKREEYVVGISCIAFSIWTLVGYLLRWKHIYCSYQNSGRELMTPDHVDWDTFEKTDAYGIPAISMILGVAILLA